MASLRPAENLVAQNDGVIKIDQVYKSAPIEANFRLRRILCVCRGVLRS